MKAVYAANFSVNSPKRSQMGSLSPLYWLLTPAYAISSGEKNKVKGCDKMVFGDFVDDKMAERREGAHISEDCDVYLI